MTLGKEKKTSHDVLNFCVSQVVEKIDFLRSESSKHEGRDEVDFGNVVGIVGERGSGKTTVLKHAIEKLAGGPDMVLKPIRPIDVKAGSLIGAILAELHVKLDELRGEVTEDKFAEALHELDEELLDLELDYARSSIRFVKNLEQSGTRGDEFSWQYAESQRKRRTGSRSFSKLIKEYLELNCKVQGKAVQNSGKLLLIVPLDDCDTRPEFLSDIFDDLHCLSVCGDVAVLFAYSNDALARAAAHKIISHYSETLGEMKESKICDTRHLTQEVSEYLRKLVPSSLRVELPNWNDPKTRLLFEPLWSSDKPLYKIFESLRFEEQVGMGSFHEYFDLSFFLEDEKGSDKSEEQVETSPYVSILPKSARGLFNLYESLSLFCEKRKNPGRPLNKEEILCVLKILVGFAAENVPFLEKKDFEKRVIWEVRGGFQLDFRDIRYAQIPDRGITICKLDGTVFREPEQPKESKLTSDIDVDGGQSGEPNENAVKSQHLVSLRVRRHGGIGATKIIEVKEGQEIKERIDYGMVMAFLNEFSLKEYQLYRGIWGSISVLGGLASNYTHDIEVDSKDTGYVALLFPEYEYYMPHFIYNFVWNTWMEELLSSSVDFPNLKDKGSKLRDYIILLHLDLILCIQMNRKFRPRLLPENLEDESKIEKESGSLKEDILKKYENLLKKNEDHKRFMSPEVFNRYFMFCCIHLLPSFVSSDELASWITRKILLSFRDSVKIEKVHFERMYSFVESTAAKDWSSEIMTAFSMGMRGLNEELFESVYSECYRKWRGRSSLFAAEIEELLNTLIKKEVLKSSDVINLGYEGFSEAIRAKLVLGQVPEHIISLLEKRFPGKVPDKRHLTPEDDSTEKKRF